MCSLDNVALVALYVNITESDNGVVNLSAFSDFASDHRVACSRPRFDLVVSWLVPIIFACIVVLGVIGNALVLGVVLCGRQMRNTTNVLILVGSYAHISTYITLVSEWLLAALVF